MSATGDVRRLVTGATWLGLLLTFIFANGIARGDTGDPSAADELGSSAAQLTILASNEQSLLVEWKLGRFDVESITQEGGTYQRLQIPHMQLTSTPGAPQVPTLGTLLGLPTTAGVKIESIEADYETLSGYRLYPAPRLSLRGDDLSSMAGGEVIESFALDSGLYATDAFYPGEIVQLGDVGTAREQAVAQVQFFPVQYNPVQSELRIYQRIVARITWDAPVFQASTAKARGSSPVYDELLRSALLNAGTLEQPTVSTNQSTPAERVTYLPIVSLRESMSDLPRLKVTIDETGLYKLTRADLLNAGMRLDALNPQTLHMYNRGEQISIYVEGEADGVFDSEDFILFYATALRDAYTAQNVYWLSAGNRAGLRMATHNGAPSGAAPSYAHFPRHIHAEEDTAYWQSMPGWGEDRWFWESRISPNAENLPSARDYKVTLGQIAEDATNARVRVRLKGYTTLSHHTRLYLNDQLLDDRNWQGQVVVEHEGSAPHAWLKSGENVLRIEAVETGAVVDQLLVNWIEIDYANRYVAVGEELLFGAGQSGPQQFDVSGFSHAQVNVFNVTDAAHPTRVVNSSVAPDGAGFKLSFEDHSLASSQYLALTPADYKLPASIILTSSSHWKSSGNGADYIIITHEDFYESALKLAEHRRASGLRVATVKVGDLYDEFNDGIFHPKAIRDFLYYAYAYWDAPAPTYVVLLGDANQDYKDNRKSGTITYVPSYNIESDLFGEVSSDNWFVTVRGDDPLPDMLIGRLSAQDRQMAEVIVNKVILYDQQPPDASWNSHVLLVADDGESAFRTTSEQLATRLPPAYRVEKVYAEDYPPGDAHGDIMNAVREGRIMVNYTGHGEYFGWGLWDGEKNTLLQVSDVALLQNGGKLPLITVGDCLNGFFAGPRENPALAEALQRQENGGAIAVWAPTGYGYTTGHRLLLDSLYAAIFTQDQRTLGAATTAAKFAAYGQSSFWREMIDTYVLFGDPATQLGVPTSGLSSGFISAGSPTPPSPKSAHRG
ncbi:MAG: hypothetical protein IT328_07040 [Caldilineaceae bacterium]|nr:hypothetical protein [Caldilineaceae bacterium]